MVADSGPIYEVTKMLSKYVGEDKPGNTVWHDSYVRYLDETERAHHLLHISEGLIYDAAGNPFDTADAKNVFSAEGRAIFVMDEHGQLYASKFQQVGEFHHSSLLAGAPIAAAGEMEVKNGKLVLISDKSGHYHPKPFFTKQALHQLKVEGIDLAGVKRDFWAPGSWYLYVAPQWLL